MILIDPTILDSTEIPGRVKNLLHALNSFSDRQGVCFPSRVRIARRMGVSLRTVTLAIREARELRLIESRSRGFHRPNLYRLTCGATYQQGGKEDTAKEPVLEDKNVNGLRPTPWKSPAEIRLLVEDIGDALGPVVAERNRRWVHLIARRVEETWIWESLSWLREAMSTGEVRCPSALLTWKLRQVGANI